MDRYAVSSLVGQGSFGCVYKAQRRGDDKVVAIKVISKVRLIECNKMNMQLVTE